MTTLATACGTVLFAILCATSLVSLGLPPNKTIGLTLFLVSLALVLGLAARLALIDSKRGHDH